NEGTMWALIRNALVGVTKGYMKRLVIEGVGYRAVAEGRKLTLTLGYSHPVYVEPPKGVDITVEKNVVTVSGIDKEKVGQVAAEIRSEREPEPYKGKGIRYEEEVVRRKAGKKAASPTV
ncbi:MAG: 50S ribosomal protein L6, partial [Candidatus Liptonbacteria bacterium]|nr:50S ribosomal protein L6 [Candidatus Liptonbacteria bacterium]